MSIIILGACNMSKKVLNAGLSFFTILLGGTLYLLFRENTIISNRFETFCDLTSVRNLLSPFSNDIFKYYLPDFLWAFSLCCGLNVLYEKKVLRAIEAGIVTILFGCAWEILQYANIIFGTADIIDVILYLTASITSVMINILILRRKK